MQPRQQQLEQHLRAWQVFLGLQQWNLSIVQKTFTRTDFPQSGDVDVDLESKTATVYLSEQPTGRDSAIILHELIHLILWDLDHYAEAGIPEAEKGEYFDRLEKAVAEITNILLQKDR